MEIRKEDLVKYHIVNTTFYAFPPSIMDKEEIPETVEEVDKELELQNDNDAKEQLQQAKRMADIVKANKKAALIAQLAELEE